MILFPKLFVVAIVLGSLVLTAAGMVLLLALLLKDKKSKSIW